MRKKASRKMTAFLTAAALCLPVPAPVFSQEKISIPSGLIHDFEKIGLPEDIAIIEDVFQGKNDKQIIIIQDAHAIPDAQRSIHRTIEYFQKNFGVRLITLEGTPSALDTRIFRSVPDKEALKNVFKELHENGEISGGGRAAVFSPFEGVYEGLEDLALYEKGLNYYLLSLSEQENIGRRLSVLSQELADEKQKIYPPELLKADSLHEEFRNHSENILPLLEQLSAFRPPPAGSSIAAILEQNKNRSEQSEITAEVKKLASLISKALLELPPGAKASALSERFNERKQAFETSGITPQEFALELSKIAAALKVPASLSARLSSLLKTERQVRAIEGSRFYEEVEDYIVSIKEALLQTAEQRALEKKNAAVFLLTKLSKLELTQKEWLRLRELEAEEPRLFEMLGDEGLEELFASHFDFYENSEERDGVFVEKVDGLLQKHKDKTAVMVTGGFHARGLTKILRENAVSYLLLMPAISSLPEEIKYKDQILEKVSWQEYLVPEDGRIDFYAAFVRAVRDRIAESAGEASGRLLKEWRDQIIRGLAASNELAKAAAYTRFIDESAAGISPSGNYAGRIQEVIGRLEQLKAAGGASPEAVLGILRTMMIQTRAAGPMSQTPGVSAAPRSELRSLYDDGAASMTDAGGYSPFSSDGELIESIISFLRSKIDDPSLFQRLGIFFPRLGDQPSEQYLLMRRRALQDLFHNGPLDDITRLFEGMAASFKNPRSLRYALSMRLSLELNNIGDGFQSMVNPLIIQTAPEPDLRGLLAAIREISFSQSDFYDVKLKGVEELINKRLGPDTPRGINDLLKDFIASPGQKIYRQILQTLPVLDNNLATDGIFPESFFRTPDYLEPMIIFLELIGQLDDKKSAEAQSLTVKLIGILFTMSGFSSPMISRQDIDAAPAALRDRYYKALVKIGKNHSDFQIAKVTPFVPREYMTPEEAAAAPQPEQAAPKELPPASGKISPGNEIEFPLEATGEVTFSIGSVSFKVFLHKGQIRVLPLRIWERQGDDAEHMFLMDRPLIGGGPFLLSRTERGVVLGNISVGIDVFAFVSSKGTASFTFDGTALKVKGIKNTLSYQFAAAGTPSAAQPQGAVTETDLVNAEMAARELAMIYEEMLSDGSFASEFQRRAQLKRASDAFGGLLRNHPQQKKVETALDVLILGSDWDTFTAANTYLRNFLRAYEITFDVSFYRTPANAPLQQSSGGVLIGKTVSKIPVNYKNFSGIEYVDSFYSTHYSSYKPGIHNEAVYVILEEGDKELDSPLNLFTVLHEAIHALDAEGDLGDANLNPYDRFNSTNLEFAADGLAISMLIDYYISIKERRPDYRDLILQILNDKMVRRGIKYLLDNPIMVYRLLEADTGTIVSMVMEGHAGSVYNYIRDIFQMLNGRNPGVLDFFDFLGQPLSQAQARQLFPPDKVRHLFSQRREPVVTLSSVLSLTGSAFDSKMTEIAGILRKETEAAYLRKARGVPVYVSDPETHLFSKVRAFLEPLRGPSPGQRDVFEKAEVPQEPALPVQTPDKWVSDDVIQNGYVVSRLQVFSGGQIQLVHPATGEPYGDITALPDKARIPVGRLHPLFNRVPSNYKLTIRKIEMFIQREGNNILIIPAGENDVFINNSKIKGSTALKFPRSVAFTDQPEAAASPAAAPQAPQPERPSVFAVPAQPEAQAPAPAPSSVRISTSIFTIGGIPFRFEAEPDGSIYLLNYQDLPHGSKKQLGDGESIVIGRDSPLLIRTILAMKARNLLGALKSISVSHAAITRRGHQYFISDAGSANGTFMDGVRISGEIEIAMNPRSELRSTEKKVFDSNVFEAAAVIQSLAGGEPVTAMEVENAALTAAENLEPLLAVLNETASSNINPLFTQRFLDSETDKLAQSVSALAQNGYAVGIEDSPAIAAAHKRNFASAVNKLNTSQHVPVAGEQVTPELRAALEENGKKVFPLGTAKRAVLALPGSGQAYLAVIKAPGSPAVSINENIIGISAEIPEEALDSMTAEYQIALKAAIGQILAHTVHTEEEKRRILQDPSALLEEYKLLENYKLLDGAAENPVLRFENGNLVISSTAVRIYLEWQAQEFARASA